MKAADLRDEVQGIVDDVLEYVPDGRLRKQADGLWRFEPDDRGADQQVQPRTFRIVIGVQEVS